MSNSGVFDNANKMFSLRIVNVDHYMSTPKSGLDLTYSQFRGAQVKSVPVFRIFGSTPSGNKTCLHIHGVFPYILVPYSGEDDAGKLMYQLASSLDKAINVSQNSSHSTRQHVFKIVQVSGRPFYGYHSQDHQFFKIFFYNPLIVKRACDLLQNGAVCGTKFQIHEGHVPFTLQFFIDYNLYGMSFINLKSVVYRKDASPAGVTTGSLPKESFCELEADAVAVDILNRLTIEGELAVNPGLAAIWQEEKKRLKRDVLETSQRPEAPLAMSEMLLREKLADNLKFQGKYKTPLKENIPYPVETQRTTGSGLLDASVLDTHSISSLVSARPSEAEETTFIDEELVLSLTQSSLLSNSLDQSLLLALDNLAAQNEVNAVMSQNVEDDSILGSQMIQDPDMFGNDISDVELEALNFSLPQDLPPENHSENETDDESDENFEVNIPQLDGVGDFENKKNKSKQSRRKRRVLVENSATDIYCLSDAEEILLNNIKDNNCWPEPGKQESLEEIFSDEEPYNSPINNFEDRCEELDLDPINVNLVSSFETVLRGDPSFTSGDLASEDVMFQPIDDSVDGSGEKKSSLIEEHCFKESQNVVGKKPVVDQNCNVDAVPSLNNSLQTVDMEKSVMLAIGDEELLNTSQLDEILNEDLNKGLEIICEKSPQPKFEENWIRSGDVLEPLECRKQPEDYLSEGLLATNVEYLCGIESSESTIVEEIGDGFKGVREENFECVQLLDGLKIEDVELKHFVNDICLDENNPQILSSIGKVDSTEKHGRHKTHFTKSPIKGSQNKLYVKFVKRKRKRRSSLNKYNSFEMTSKEIETYFSQLQTLTKYLTTRDESNEPQPILWVPIRKSINLDNLAKKRVQNPKIKSAKRILKKRKFSKNEILRMKSCIVRVEKLTDNKIMQLSGKPINKLNNLKESRNKIKNNRSKKRNMKTGPIHLQHIPKPRESSLFAETNSVRGVSIEELSIKKENSSKNVDNSVKKCELPQKSTEKLPDELPMYQLKEKHSKNNVARKSQHTKTSPLKLLNTPVCQKKSSKPGNNGLKKSLHERQKTPLKLPDKDSILNLQKMDSSSTDLSSDLCYVQNISNKCIKEPKTSKKDEMNELRQKEIKPAVKQILLHDSEISSCEEKQKNITRMQRTDESMKSDSTPSCKNLEVEKNQSICVKLNTNCVIKLLPLPVDKANAKKNKDSAVTKSTKKNVSSDSQLGNHVASKKRRLDNVSTPKKLNKEKYINPLVKVERLITSFRTSDVNFEKETKSDVESKKQNSYNKDEVNPPNKSLEQSGCSKSHSRIYSLDGTMDNSSSDENIDDKGSTSEPTEVKNNFSTPNKRRKSKSSRSPRHYVPLNIEIRKSPKVKRKTETEKLVKPDVSEQLTTESRSHGVATDLFQSSTSQVKNAYQKSSDSSKNHERRMSMDPLVSIQRLPSSLTYLPSLKRDSADSNQPTTVTTAHPIVKRLKVCVKRLSLDTRDNVLEHENVKVRGRFHRSFSLPITSE